MHMNSDPGKEFHSKDGLMPAPYPTSHFYPLTFLKLILLAGKQKVGMKIPEMQF